MANSYEIPLDSTPQKFTIELGGVLFNLRLRYCYTPMGGWIMDIMDQSDAPYICGIPLVTGCDLLEQYRYIGIGGSLYVSTDHDPSVPPQYNNLGITSHLYWYA
jgi:hypothetical protein